jgi:hypothetical protein
MSQIVRLLSLQAYVAFSGIAEIKESIVPGVVNILLKYIAGDPEDFKASWTSSQIEYVTLIRLVPTHKLLFSDSLLIHWFLSYVDCKRVWHVPKGLGTKTRIYC